MILLDFFLLQLLTGLTLSDPHLSIILHVIRKILHHPFIFAKSCNFFSKMYSFLLQSNWNIYVLCHQMFESTQWRYQCCGCREKGVKWREIFTWTLTIMSGLFSSCCHALMLFIPLSYIAVTLGVMVNNIGIRGFPVVDRIVTPHGAS